MHSNYFSDIFKALWLYLLQVICIIFLQIAFSDKSNSKTEYVEIVHHYQGTYFDATQEVCVLKLNAKK